MNFSKMFIQSAITASLGNRVGSFVYKTLFAFFPGVGNTLNAGVSALTTGTLGKCLISFCERMQKEATKIQNIEQLENIIKKRL